MPHVSQANNNNNKSKMARSKTKAKSNKKGKSANKSEVNKTTKPSKLLDVTVCSKEELQNMRLPGLGANKSKAVTKYREAHKVTKFTVALLSRVTNLPEATWTKWVEEGHVVLGSTVQGPAAPSPTPVRTDIVGPREGHVVLGSKVQEPAVPPPESHDAVVAELQLQLEEAEDDVATAEAAKAIAEKQHQEDKKKWEREREELLRRIANLESSLSDRHSVPSGSPCSDSHSNSKPHLVDSNSRMVSNEMRNAQFTYPNYSPPIVSYHTESSRIEATCGYSASVQIVQSKSRLVEVPVQPRNDHPVESNRPPISGERVLLGSVTRGPAGGALSELTHTGPRQGLPTPSRSESVHISPRRTSTLKSSGKSPPQGGYNISSSSLLHRSKGIGEDQSHPQYQSTINNGSQPYNQFRSGADQIDRESEYKKKPNVYPEVISRPNLYGNNGTSIHQKSWDPLDSKDQLGRPHKSTCGQPDNVFRHPSDTYNHHSNDQGHRDPYVQPEWGNPDPPFDHLWGDTYRPDPKDMGNDNPGDGYCANRYLSPMTASVSQQCYPHMGTAQRSVQEAFRPSQHAFHLPDGGAYCQ